MGLRFFRSNPEFRRRLSGYITDLQSGYPRVLIVDDDEDFRAALADGLGVLGMTVDFAESGEDALQKLVEHLFQIDLVLLDIRMPGLDGRGFLHRVRQLGGELDLPIVVLSAAPRAELQSLKGPHAANDVLSKNDPLEEIAGRVKDVLGR
jgi:CheY-like chemotaxis protein